MDESTVKKLAELRRTVQLEQHIPDLDQMENELTMEPSNDSEDAVSVVSFLRACHFFTG